MDNTYELDVDCVFEYLGAKLFIGRLESATNQVPNAHLNPQTFLEHYQIKFVLTVAAGC